MDVSRCSAPSTPGRFYDLQQRRLTIGRCTMQSARARGRHGVLDLGCGTGLLSARIRRDLPGTRVVCCDFSYGMLRQAADHGHGSAWAQGNAMRLPFGDACFDTVVSTESFHWFPDQTAALAECFRALASGGRLLVALVNPPAEMLSGAMYAASRLVGEPFYWPTRQHMCALVEAAGFRVVAQRRVYRLPAGRLFPPVLTIAVRP